MSCLQGSGREVGGEYKLIKFVDEKKKSNVVKICALCAAQQLTHLLSILSTAS